MNQLVPRNNENVAKFFRHYRRGVYLRWAAACVLDGASANTVAKEYNAARTLHRVTPRFVAQKVAWVLQVVREADPGQLVLLPLLRGPRFFWWTLTLWRAGFTMHDILTLSRSDISHHVRGIGWTSITNIRRFAAHTRAA